MERMGRMRKKHNGVAARKYYKGVLHSVQCIQASICQALDWE